MEHFKIILFRRLIEKCKHITVFTYPQPTFGIPFQYYLPIYQFTSHPYRISVWSV